MLMLAQPRILRNQAETVFNGCRVDETVGRVARETRRQRDRGLGNRGCDGHGPNVRGKTMKPGVQRDRQGNALMPG